MGPALATAHPSSANGSSSASATWIAHGSPVPSVGTNTQEFNKSTNTITAAAWASGGALNTARANLSGAGTQTLGLVFGGGTTNNETEEYDGSTWSEHNNLNIGIGAGTCFCI